MFTRSLKCIAAYTLFGTGVQQYDNEKRRILYLLGINKFAKQTTDGSKHTFYYRQDIT